MFLSLEEVLPQVSVLVCGLYPEHNSMDTGMRGQLGSILWSLRKIIERWDSDNLIYVCNKTGCLRSGCEEESFCRRFKHDD